VQFGARYVLCRKAAAGVAELEKLARANISQRVRVEYRLAVNREAMLKASRGEEQVRVRPA
jgi:hypothetical protein